MIDLSFVIGAVIAVMIAFVIYKVWPAMKAFIPAGALYFINWFADVVVRAVESDFAGEGGGRKREEAFRRINEAMAPIIEFLHKLGYDISAERIYEAIQAAWIRLDLDEVRAGIKPIEYEYEDEEDDKPPESEE